MNHFKPGDRVFHLGLLRNGTVHDGPGPAGHAYVHLDGTQRPEMRHISFFTLLGEPMKHDFTHAHGPHGNQSHLDIAMVPEGLRLTITAPEALSGWFKPEQAPAIAHAILTADEDTPTSPAVARAILALEEHAQVVAIGAMVAAEREAPQANTLTTKDLLIAAKEALTLLTNAGATGKPKNNIEPRGLENAVDSLNSYITTQERDLQKAIDQQEMVIAANVLYNERRTACDPVWPDLSDTGKLLWIATARKARELFGATE